MAGHTWSKDSSDRLSPALLRLQETLLENKVPLDIAKPLRAEVLVRRLNESMPQLATHSLKEILLAGDAGATAKVLSTVLDAATDPNPTIGRRLCKVYVTENSSIKIPKAAVSKHSWGEPKRASEETASFTTIDVEKSSGLARISKDMIEDAEWDVVERQLAELGRAAFEFQSNYIIDTMVTDAGNTVAAASSGTLAADDLASLLALMMADNCYPDVLVLNPTEYADLIKDADIQNWINYRQAPALAPGQLVPYLGQMRLEVSTFLASGTALIVDSRRSGALVIRRDVTVDEYDDVVNDLVALPCTQRWMYGTLDANAIGKVTSA